MAKGAPDEYGSAGSVPYAPNVAPTGLGTPNRNISANGADFGAQVGAGMEKVGEAAQQLTDQYGKMVNETLMTKADVDFTTKLGQLKGDYISKSGLAAFNAFPQYQKDVAQAFQDTRANLPGGAQHGFDMLGAKTMGNHIADGSTYAASQLKEANRASGSDLTNVNIQAALDPSVAADPERVQWHQDSAIYGLQTQLDDNHPGLKTDPETGEVGFDESTPEGKGLKAQYEANKSDIITRIQTSRFDTLAKSDPLGAFDAYKNVRDELPKQTQITLDAKFEPIVFNAHKDNAVGHTVAQSQEDYANKLYNPDISKTPLDVVQKNEGGMSDDGLSAFGIDKNAHPKEFAEISSLPESDRSAYARKFFKEEYYDKKGIADLPANVQSIVLDGVVNHTNDFGDKLIRDAKNGASPQELIDERRAEYQRVAQIPGKEQYLQGWNNRLDNLQNGNALTGEKTKSYATNPDGSMLTQADYYRTHSDDVLAKGDSYADQVMPGDLAFKRAVRETLNNHMSKVQSNQDGQYMLDNKNVMRGITGEFTKGTPSQTEQELRAIPGMNDLLNKVSAQDPRFAETIPTLISKASRRNDVTNSPNSYETITRVLQPQDDLHPNHIKNQSQLDTLLGKNDGTGINMKDYNDAKVATDFQPETKEPILKKMQDIASANGNVDGKGQQRAVQWYNQAVAAIKKNDSLGDKKETDLNKILPPVQMPSRMGQLSDLALAKVKEKAALTFVSPDDPEFAKLPSGAPFKDANGNMWTKK